MQKKVGNVLIQVMKDLSSLSTNGSAEIKINSNICKPKEFSALFYYFRKGTVLEKIDLDINEYHPTANCSCGYQERISEETQGYVKCPECGKFAEVKDQDYKITDPDPQQADTRKSIRF